MDGIGQCGFLRSADGGGMQADILTYQQGQNQDHWRQAGKPKFQDITFVIGMGMSPKFYDWIASFFARKGDRRNGAIVAADFNYNEVARRTFSDALISQVDLPGLDAAKSEAAYMTIKVVPENVIYEQPKSGAKIKPPESKTQPSKLWQCSSFELKVDGLEAACARVTKVDQLTIKQQILEYHAGHRRFSTKVPGRLEYPNVTFYVPSVDAGPFLEASKKRLVNYDAPPAQRLTGAITYLTQDKKPLCTISLKGLDVIVAEGQKFDASADAFHMVKVQLQCEKLEFKYEQASIDNPA